MTTKHLEVFRHKNMDASGFGPRVMMQIKVCLHCGSVGTASQLFCTECGHKLPRHSLYHRYKETHRCCQICDTVVSNQAVYCPQCGKKL